MTRFLSLEFVFLLHLLFFFAMLSSSGNLSLATVQTTALPALPKIPDISCGPSAGATITVNAGADFQAALNAAKSGDTILLQRGVTYRGSFVLPPKTGTQCITIKPASMIALPPDGVRVNPAQHASAMPKLVSPNTAPVVLAPADTHHYRFLGIEFKGAAGINSNGLIVLGLGNETTLTRLPHHFEFDRVYVHGDPVVGGKRGIQLNSASTTIMNSYIADIKRVGQDTQAICGWNGPGPFRIINNYLEAAGENVMFGGADPSIANLVPSDIEIRHNHFFKPLSWKTDDPSYAGIHWSVKNLFELKNAQRVLLDGNVLEHSWVDGQTGYAIKLTSSNQNNLAPWTQTADVTITNNLIRHAAQGIFFQAANGIYPSLLTQRILISNNLFTDIGGLPWSSGSSGILFGIFGVDDLTIEHNTALQTGTIVTAEGITHRWVYRNNLAPHNTYGVIGTGLGVGNPTLATDFPEAVFERNVITGPWPTSGGATVSMYSNCPDNFFPSSISDIGFVNFAAGDYHLSASSPYKHAGTDGKDVGVDWSVFNAAQVITR